MSGPGAVLALLAGHLLAALVAGPVFRRFKHWGFALIAAAPGATFLWCISRVLDSAREHSMMAHVEQLSWAPSLGFELTVRVDSFSLLMLTIISGVGTLVLIYSVAYFAVPRPVKTGPEQPASAAESQEQSLEATSALRRKARIGALLVAFAGAMAGVVVCDNVLAIFMFWELTSVISFLLIGTEDHSPSARAAALRAYLTTAAGGLALLGGLVILANSAGTWSLAEILADPPNSTSVTIALGLILVGAFTKSAQFPFHYWLAPAMAAPTPVSAYLHSATMVKAGVFVIARFSGPFATVGFWKPTVVTVGAITMILGAWRALSQRDLKVLLAHGTVSQLGFMVVLFGIGGTETTQAGVALLIGHCLFKAALFMSVGVIDKGTGTRNVDELQRLWPRMRVTVPVTVVAAASMAGVPPFVGFIAKESAIGALFDDRTILSVSALTVVVVGSVLTAGYSARIIGAVFGQFYESSDQFKAVEGSTALIVPGVVLSGMTLGLGLLPVLIAPAVTNITAELAGHEPHSHLELWHGIGPTLGLSMLILAAGAGLWFTRVPVAAIQQRSRFPFSAARIFDLGISALLRGSDRVIGRIQTGSLPFYLIVVFATALILPTLGLLAGDLPSLSLRSMDDPSQIVVVSLIFVALAGAIATRHRLGAVLCIGATGYGVAVMFMINGAPDLALTQLLVETLAVVVFVLVLRHLPREFAFNQTAFSILPRALLSIAVGVGAAIFALMAYAGRPDGVAPVSDAYVRASPEAGGKNVVNVILVDFRAFDTMGEISVLTVAALGVLGLVRAVRRQRSRDSSPLAPLRRSFVLDAAVRSLFQTLLLVSVLLLLAGHDEPGGGFVAGLVAGSAFLLVYLAGGDRALRLREPLAAEVFLGAGLVTAISAGSLGWLRGGVFLESRTWKAVIPVMGTMKISTALLFEIGVYLVVVGVTMSILRALGREEVYET